MLQTLASGAFLSTLATCLPTRILKPLTSEDKENVVEEMLEDENFDAEEADNQSSAMSIVSNSAGSSMSHAGQPDFRELEYKLARELDGIAEADLALEVL